MILDPGKLRTRDPLRPPREPLAPPSSAFGMWLWDVDVLVFRNSANVYASQMFPSNVESGHYLKKMKWFLALIRRRKNWLRFLLPNSEVLFVFFDPRIGHFSSLHHFVWCFVCSRRQAQGVCWLCAEVDPFSVDNTKHHIFLPPQWFTWDRGVTAENPWDSPIGIELIKPVWHDCVLPRCGWKGWAMVSAGSSGTATSAPSGYQLRTPILVIDWFLARPGFFVK